MPLSGALGVVLIMIPLSKHDLDSVEKLSAASDSEVIAILPDLFKWFEDCNWPVFPAICKRISKLQTGHQTEIKNVLLGQDVILKCNVVGHLFPLMDLAQVLQYRSLLQSLVDNASLEDFTEGLIDYVEIQLSRIAKNT